MRGETPQLDSRGNNRGYKLLETGGNAQIFEGINPKSCGLDPRIHAVAGVASDYCEHVDGRIKSIKSGPDRSQLHKGHCACGSVPMANSPDSPAGSRDQWLTLAGAGSRGSSAGSFVAGGRRSITCGCFRRSRAPSALAPIRNAR